MISYTMYFFSYEEYLLILEEDWFFWIS